MIFLEANLVQVSAASWLPGSGANGEEAPDSSALLSPNCPPPQKGAVQRPKLRASSPLAPPAGNNGPDLPDIPTPGQPAGYGEGTSRAIWAR